MIVTFEDCQWVADKLWRAFFTDKDTDHSDIEESIKNLDLSKLLEKKKILEESVLYARAAALMVESDLQEKENISNIFAFESQTDGS